MKYIHTILSKKLRIKIIENTRTFRVKLYDYILKFLL